MSIHQKVFESASFLTCDKRARRRWNRRPAGRTQQEIDYGQRASGYVFGALHPALGDVFAVPYGRCTIASWVDTAGAGGYGYPWLPADHQRVYAILDNLSTHHTVDVLFFGLTHPRWEFVFQPGYAAYLNLIAP